MPAGCPGDAFLRAVGDLLHDRFAIGHATIQVERDDLDDCAQAPAAAL